MKTFTKRFNAQRAARNELGDHALEGIDFRTTKSGRTWAWEIIVNKRASSDIPSVIADEAEPLGSDPSPEEADAAERDAAFHCPAPIGVAVKPSVGIAGLKPEADPVAAANAASWPTPKKGKRAAVIEKAKGGELPIPPDFSKSTHARFRSKLAKIVALAKAGDIEGLRAVEINSVSTSPKAMARYRDLAVIALEARLKSA